MESNEEINYVGKSITYNIGGLEFSGVVLEDTGDKFTIFLTDVIEYTEENAKDDNLLKNYVPKRIMKDITITGTKF